MLVLTRKVHEEIVIEMPDGRTGTVVLTRIEPGKIPRAGLGFVFPDDVIIRRRELIDRDAETE